MSTPEKKPLFELTATELEEELADMFSGLGASHPIRHELAVSLMAAHAATQKIALQALSETDATTKNDEGFTSETLSTVLETFETINGFLLEGQPCRIDSVLWDAAGFIHGWFFDEHGRPDVRFGSCPEVVAELAAALQTLAQCQEDWRAPLERRAINLASLVRLAREKAELQARSKVESQNWLKKLISPTSLERELLSLGFR